MQQSTITIIICLSHDFKIVHVGEELTESQGTIKIGKMICLMIKMTEIILRRHLIIGAR